MLTEMKTARRVTAPSFLRDCLVIANVQNANNYKIAAYGTAKTFAEQLGLNLPDEVLGWEKDTNRILSRIAIQQVNAKVAQAPS